jgi:N-acetylmuramoyl-L-alanine amidase
MGKRVRCLLLLLQVFLTSVCYGENRRFTLVIDAGHGGHDAGALGAFSKEKDINLNVALVFGRYVERNCPDVKVVYTRKTDVFIPLDERANIANKNKADLFVSIHTNALPGGKIARGVETYTLGMARAAANLDVAKRENSVILVEQNYSKRYEGFNPNSSESYIMFEFMQDKYMEKSVNLAKQVQSQVCNVTHRANKGVHQAGFLVLRCTSMPSCLIELGFITTPDEEQYLNSDNGIDELGRGIYQAFVNYKNKHNDNVTIPFTASETKVPTIVDHDDNSVTISEDKDKKKLITETEQNISQTRNDVITGVSEEPIFKVQIVASNRDMSLSSTLFKGLDSVNCYQENGMFKYTYGASSNYNEVYRLRKSLLDKFPQAFIIAFKDGQKMDINAAIREFKSKRK